MVESCVSCTTLPPTVNSDEYTEPITAPEGNNILSAIAVDKYGQISNIAKKNYIVAESEPEPEHVWGEDD